MNNPFQFINGQLAHSKEELLKLCEQNPDDATNYLIKEDLEKWLAYIGDYELAECATNARQTDVSDRQKLEEFLTRSYSLTAPKPAPPAVPESASVATPPKTQTPETKPAASPSEEAKAKIASSPQVEANQNPRPAPTPVAATNTAATKGTATPPQKAPQSAKAEPNSNEKPSFFQVVAGFIVNILYRNKK